MPSTLPDGEPAPGDGSLPASSYADFGGAPFGVYVHIPFCAVRCGYCDFNTYTAPELGNTDEAGYVAAAVAEVRLARRVLGDRDVAAATVFFGGGTPTLLPPRQLGTVLNAISDDFGLQTDAEVTVEANPDSVTAASLHVLREVGFNRISFGMQSAAPQVLATLDRTHDPAGVPLAVQWAREAGFDVVSLDLIYGTPGESAQDWRHTLEAALAMQPDHISAYALIVEDGTRLAARVRRGELPAPDDDDLADKYLAADDLLQSAGLTWYEVSNWARGEHCIARHNTAYWLGHDWWGVGPGAHSHVAGTRWWNVKHPAAYAARLKQNASPAQAREVLDDDARRVEQILLRMRLRDGYPVGALRAPGQAAAERARADGLLQQAAYDEGRAVLTLRGRLLADAVVRDLVD